MAYVLLIMEPPGIREARSAADGEALYRRMEAFSADLKARGVLRVSQSLKSDAGSVRLRRRAGRSTLVDGPFAEAKEIVGGFFWVTCESRAEAVAIAEECPAAEWATIEVRELGACYE